MSRRRRQQLRAHFDRVTTAVVWFWFVVLAADADLTDYSTWRWTWLLLGGFTWLNTAHAYKKGRADGYRIGRANGLATGFGAAEELSARAFEDGFARGSAQRPTDTN